MKQHIRPFTKLFLFLMKQLILASSNSGKIKEIKAILSEFSVIPYSDIMTPFEIVEDGNTFAANAVIKVKAIWEKLTPEQRENSIVISDDSGISIEVPSV